MTLYGNCCKSGCTEKLHGMNSKPCKLCQQPACLSHLQPENHNCPKVIYTKYIRRDDGILRKYGQNVTTGVYTIVCETCGYVSDYPKLIENAGYELEKHLKENPDCMTKKRTFLEESVIGNIERANVQSSIVRDPNRTLWVCSHCRPPRKFTNHEEYVAHHFTHS